MNEKDPQSPKARRSFLARLGFGAGVLGAAAAASPAALAQVTAGASWRPARHSQDDWLDKIPGQHRFVFDTITADGIGWGLRFTGNYFTANQEAYGLKDNDLAVLIVVRHKSTPFGYNDAMWAKYGKYLSEHSEFTDPKTKEPPKVNLFAAEAEGSPIGMDALIKKGVHFAVCQMSTRVISGKIAKGTGAESENVFKELSANLVANGHSVPAGIVAVNRAQERGYSFTFAI
jgi:intracellular sulfur oxidation DsrE/DsrF family protein